MADKLYNVYLEADADVAGLIEFALELADLDMSQWSPEGSDQVRFDAYFEELHYAEICVVELQELLEDHIHEDDYKIQLSELPEKDWQEAWKEFFHVIKVSPRIVIKPTWESHDPASTDIVIEIDPGMSFGTGNHPTTRACITFLDDLAAQGKAGSFLDLGCGSGILSIAAVKLGFSPVKAMDNDPVAIDYTERNLAMNGISDSVSYETADLDSFDPGTTYGIVAANMRAVILEEHMANIVRHVAPSGILLLAGILTDQYKAIHKQLKKLGFKETDTIEDEGWIGAKFVSR